MSPNNCLNRVLLATRVEDDYFNTTVTKQTLIDIDFARWEMKIAHLFTSAFKENNKTLP